ncbi:hypothetical protein JCM3765_002883 [Sporobolomyces pararoseus]
MTFPAFSFNFAGIVFPLFTLTAAPLAVLLSFLLLYIVTHPIFTKTTLHRKKPLTLTQHNTLLNRNENGGTGVWSRKWRRKVATALAMAPLRRGLGDSEDDFEDDGDEADYSSGSEFWKVKIKPAPVGLKGVLKREGTFEVARRISIKDGGPGSPSRLDDVQEKEKTPASTSTISPISSLEIDSSPDDPARSPSISTSSSLLTRGPVLSSSEESKRTTKTVSIQEPSLVELEALRELWNSEDMQNTVNGGNGLGGIAGYRRTRDFYARGQGGRGINKAALPSSTTSTTSTTLSKTSDPILAKEELALKQPQEKEKAGEGDDNGSPRPRRPLNPSLTRSSSSSLSPSPGNRRPLVKRALSPNANGVVVSSSSSRRRGLSPSNATISGANGPSSMRSTSASPGPALDRAQPRWIKPKKNASPSSRTSTSKGRATGQKVQELDDDEGGGTGRNGTMSATVSDDEGEYEDVPPTPPSQPSLTLAMAPISASSTNTTPITQSILSPSLELLLERTNRSLGLENLDRDETKQEGVSCTSPRFTGAEFREDPPSPVPPLLDSQSSHLPTPSPSPILSPRSATNTPSFSITPATPDIPLASLPPLSPLLGSISQNENSEDSDDAEEDPNDPLSSPTVEAKGVVSTLAHPSS